jgi:dephospho-CoA kinase
MLKIGLTGNMCSGHDKVAKIFRNMNVPVFDADVAIKFLLNYREDMIKNIRIQFGDNIFDKGIIQPSKFNSTEKFDRLLDIIELELLKLYESWRLCHKSSSYTVFKCSILFERNLDKNMNYTISSFRPRYERAQSLVQTGLTMIQAYDILDSELDELQKNQRSTWIINNDEDVILQTKKIHEIILSKSIKGILDNIDYQSSMKNMFT